VSQVKTERMSAIFRMYAKRRGRRLLQEGAAYLHGLARRLLCAERGQHATAQRRDKGAIAAEGSRRMNGDVSGATLVAAMQASLYPEVEIQLRRWRLPVRDSTP